MGQALRLCVWRGILKGENQQAPLAKTRVCVPRSIVRSGSIRSMLMAGAAACKGESRHAAQSYLGSVRRAGRSQRRAAWRSAETPFRSCHPLVQERGLRLLSDRAAGGSRGDLFFASPFWVFVQAPSRRTAESFFCITAGPTRAFLPGIP